MSDSKHARVVGLPINYVLRNPHFSINSGAKFSHIIISLISTRITTITKKYILTTWQIDKLTVQIIRLTRSLKLIRTHLSMYIFWYTSENSKAIIQQKKGSACSLTNIINSWSCYKGRRNMGQMRIRKTKGAIIVERIDKGSSIQSKNMAETNLQSR